MFAVDMCHSRSASKPGHSLSTTRSTGAEACRQSNGSRHSLAGAATRGGRSGDTGLSSGGNNGRQAALLGSSRRASLFEHSSGLAAARLQVSSSSSSDGRRAAVPRWRRRHFVTAASWPLVGRPAAAKRLFVFGLGYTGLGAASYFLKRDWMVAGTCRSLEKRELLEQRGITAFYFDPAEFDNLGGKALECLRHATHVLSTVPPDANDDEQDPVILAHAQQLSEHGDGYKWVGYISSTSVYGNYEGAWVDETSELRAAGGKGWSRVMAEHEWLALHESFGLPVHIFRCGGIYGPRRSAIETVQRQWNMPGGAQWRPSASQGRRWRQSYTTRCHVYDICQVLEASLKHPNPGAAYNIVDDDPADRATVMQYAAELLERQAAGLTLEGWATGSLSASGWGWGGDGDVAMGVSSLSSSTSSGSYDSGEEAAAAWQGLGRAHTRPCSRREAAAVARLEEKRVRNARIKQELGVHLRFPTYREGLGAIAAGDMRPFD